MNDLENMAFLLSKFFIKISSYLSENSLNLFKDERIKRCSGKEGVLVFEITRNT
jgi:hypothetical protein